MTGADQTAPVKEAAVRDPALRLFHWAPVSPGACFTGRRFHWALAIFVCASWLPGQFGPAIMTRHFQSGYVVIGLLAFRLANALLALATLHVAIIGFHRFWKRGDLPRPMLTGRKRVRARRL